MNRIVARLIMGIGVTTLALTGAGAVAACGAGSPPAAVATSATSAGPTDDQFTAYAQALREADSSLSATNQQLEDLGRSICAAAQRGVTGQSLVTQTSNAGLNTTDMRVAVVNAVTLCPAEASSLAGSIETTTMSQTALVPADLPGKSAPDALEELTNAGVSNISVQPAPGTPASAVGECAVLTADQCAGLVVTAVDPSGQSVDANARITVTVRARK